MKKFFLFLYLVLAYNQPDQANDGLTGIVQCSLIPFTTSSENISNISSLVCVNNIVFIPNEW